jgi:hypothetical protein
MLCGMLQRAHRIAYHDRCQHSVVHVHLVIEQYMVVFLCADQYVCVDGGMKEARVRRHVQQRQFTVDAARVQSKRSGQLYMAFGQNVAASIGDALANVAAQCSAIKQALAEHCTPVCVAGGAVESDIQML